MRWLAGISDLMDMSSGRLRETVRDGEARHAAVHGSRRAGHDLATEHQLMEGTGGWGEMREQGKIQSLNFALNDTAIVCRTTTYILSS